MSTFWGKGGKGSTLSAENITQSVTIDAKPYSCSRIKDKGLVLLPNIKIENIIGGSGSTIYLNEFMI